MPALLGDRCVHPDSVWKTPARCLALALIGGAAALSGRSAWAESFTTNIINGAATNAGASYVVGQTGSFNYLEIRSGGGLTNGTGVIGFSISASSNSALVTGNGSRWINTSNFYVGFTGPENRLTISSGGLVKCNSGYVANDTYSSNNAVLVTGAGSRWESFDQLAIGYDGPGNRLTITNGGSVLCHSDGFVGGFDDSSGHNTASVIGNGSMWINEGDLYIGYFSSDNALTVTSGGRITNEFGYIGAFGSSNNRVVVSGGNTVWNARGGDLSLGGEDSSNNRLVITNGGLLNSLGARVGGETGAHSNQVVVVGANSRWFISGDFYAGDSGSFSQLTVLEGGQIANTNGYIGYNATANGNAVFVSGAGSRWTNQSDLSVGHAGSGNTLTILSTGQVSSANGYVGASGDANSNAVLVAGAGSQWSNSVSLEIGFSGRGNSLVISNGGKVISAFGRIGTYGSNTLVLVTGTNSQWLDSGDLYLGQTGAANALQIENGGMLTNFAAYVGVFGADASVLVTGAGSQWRTRGDLIIGYGAPANQLGLQAGALVQATNLVMGFFDESTNNLISVSSASLIVTNPAGTARIDLRHGTLGLTNGTVRTAILLVAAGAGIVGNGSITASAVTNSGVLSPGSSTGRLDIGANVTLKSDSVLDFDLGGYDPGVTHDLLSISDSMVLGGMLAVRFASGFERTITNGATFILLTADSITGSLSNVSNGSRLLTVDGFADFLVSYSGNQLVLSDPRLDFDGDGLPNWWEMAFGLDPNAPSDAGQDADGDGLTNAQEYQAGTDPTDPSSNLRIAAVVLQTNDLRVVWTTVGGKNYILQATDGSIATNFIDLSPQISVPGTGESATNFVDIDAALNAAARYYRVRLVP